MLSRRSFKFTLSVLVFVVAGCSEPASEEKGSNVYDRVAMTAEDANPLFPGLRAPSFSIPAADGSTYTFDAENLGKPVVIIFYRGGWCPWCNRHLAAMRSAEQELLALGYEILFVSADHEDVLSPSLKTEDITYTLLSDNEMDVARDYGVAFKLSQETIDRYNNAGIDLVAASGYDHYILPVPATFVIGTDGYIKFMYANPDYRVRVNPDLLVMAAKLAVEEAE